MNKPLLLSLSVATLLVGTNLSAAPTMYERFEAMEKEMNRLKQEIATLKAAKPAPATTASAKPASKPAKAKADDDEDEDDDKPAPKATAVAAKPAVNTPAVAAGATVPVVAVKAGAKDDDEDEDEKPAKGAKGAKGANSKEFADVDERLSELEETVSEISRATSGSHLKFNIDYRFAIENMDYKMADGSKAKNDAYMTNRLWLDFGYQATGNLSFAGQLAYNKAFGARSGASNPVNASFEGFDWVANENSYDDEIRVRSAYLFYKNVTFMGLDVPWTFSIGRRPSTGGHLVNFRDDDKATSPLGHSINVEFDGLSSKFTLNKDYGTYVKFCAGRGMSNAAPKFTSTPYADVDTGANSNIDLAGLIFAPLDTKKYQILTQYYYAANLIDANINTDATMVDSAGNVVPNPMFQRVDYTKGFTTVGGLHSITASASAQGIGKGWGMDDVTLFASFATSITDPKDDQRMLGSAAGESKTGTSYWVGAQVPSLFTEGGRWGVEYNHGSKYWRAITYGEDTNIGSKLAARGDAYEAYMTEYLIDNILTLQLRYTYIDYKYSGSNGFFGNTSGTAMSMEEAIAAGQGANVVDTAQDIRLYLRYRY